MTDLRKALGDPFLTGHSGCPEGPHVKLAYETVAEAMAAHDALVAFLATKRRLPFHMDPDAQAAVLADLPESVAQEAGEFYENAGAGHRKPLKKREAMAVAWKSVLRPYLIGLRDHHARQVRPLAPTTEARRAGTATGPVHEGVVGEAEAPSGSDHDSATAMPGRAEGVSSTVKED